jgi:hypothetical protein
MATGPLSDFYESVVLATVELDMGLLPLLGRFAR